MSGTPRVGLSAGVGVITPPPAPENTGAPKSRPLVLAPDRLGPLRPFGKAPLPAGPQTCSRHPPAAVCGVRGAGWGGGPGLWAPPLTCGRRAALSAPGGTAGVGRARILPGRTTAENTVAVAPSQSRELQTRARGHPDSRTRLPRAFGRAGTRTRPASRRADREAGRLEVPGICRPPARRPNWRL